MAKVTGIGGIFFKSVGKASELAAWYKKNLDLDHESWCGVILKWPDDKAGDGGLMVWSTADNDTKMVQPANTRTHRRKTTERRRITMKINAIDRIVEKYKSQYSPSDLSSENGV
jgi:hypothetical protein